MNEKPDINHQSFMILIMICPYKILICRSGCPDIGFYQINFLLEKHSGDLSEEVGII